MSYDQDIGPILTKIFGGQAGVPVKGPLEENTDFSQIAKDRSQYTPHVGRKQQAKARAKRNGTRWQDEYGDKK